MSTIPQEYLDSGFDFGFSAVDDPEESQTQTQTPPPPTYSPDDIAQPILERIQSLEINVGEILNILERLEQTGTPNLDTDEYKGLIEKDVKEKLKTIEGLILPLLVNLMKNPDKDYIHWPNRAPLIQKQIDKILAITRT